MLLPLSIVIVSNGMYAMDVTTDVEPALTMVDQPVVPTTIDTTLVSPEVHTAAPVPTLYSADTGAIATHEKKFAQKKSTGKKKRGCGCGK